MQYRIKLGLWLAIYLCLGVVLFFGSSQVPAAAQQPQETDAGVFITVTNPEQINVRSGPNAVYYPKIGELPVGATAHALGRSSGGEWIQIVYDSAPDGIGWVYAPLVELSPGFLPIVEPPPTPTPLETPTLNPTFVAAFQAQSTSTHLPTFTLPPPLVIPSYENTVDGFTGRLLVSWAILVFGIVGFLGFIVSSFRGNK